MKKCTIYHTGVGSSADGVIKENKVYNHREEDNTPYFPEEMFLAREECEGGVTQFEVEGKWGFADIYSGEIMIEPIWDYAGPFYRGYAHVALGVQLELNHGYDMAIHGGKHGYINTNGEIIIPLEYGYACEIPYRRNKYFQVSKNGKWGLINNQNKIIIPFNWDRLETSYDTDLIFCAVHVACEPYVDDYSRLISAMFGLKPEVIADMIAAEPGLNPTRTSRLKWGVYDNEFNLIVQPELDEKPFRPKIKSNVRGKSFSYSKKYYILRKDKKYGVLCNDGRWIANIEFSKKQAKNMINSICERRYSGNLYI